MSPPKSKKAASRTAAKKAGKAAKSAKAPRKAAKSSKKGAKGKPSAKAARTAKPTASATGHAHCAATDPFGGTCQNLPRRPSKYCVIHSYLER